MNVLIIEDERRLAEALGQVIGKNRYAVERRYDGESGLDEALTGRYDIIILDIMLPKLNGLEVLHQLRGEAVMTPVLLLTAKDEIQDKVKGLDGGGR